jgi:tRNA nucleotidyltransferase (CCA-adding enzyme)
MPAPGKTGGGARWDHFPHGADVGVRGYGPNLACAFEQAALALTAAVTDPEKVSSAEPVVIACAAPERELLLAEWLNAIIYEMAVRRMLFARFAVTIDGEQLTGRAWGEAVDRRRHQPAAEPKGGDLYRVEGSRDAGGRLACAVCRRCLSTRKGRHHGSRTTATRR